MSEEEISISKDGVTLKGEVVEDVRKPIKRLANTADSFLRLVDNFVGLPLDFMSYHLEPFRAKYSSNFNKIPEEDLCEANFRLACSVLKNVAYAAEESDIQELFANLLASSSDKKKSAKVHPGFATVINEMTSLDSKVLMDFYAIYNQKYQRINFTSDEQSLIHQSEANLIRLGLLTFNDREYNQNEINKFAGKTNFHAPQNLNDMSRVLVDLLNDHQKLKNVIVNDRINSTKRQKLEITQFGKNFLSVVYKFDG